MGLGRLPSLRQELSLHEGPVGENGTPTWVLQDPVSHRHFRIEWLPFEILSRWHLRDAATIAAAVGRDTTLAATPDDVAAVLRFLQDNELVQLRGAAGTDWYTKIMADRSSRLRRCLFFRVPLLRPDAWLLRNRRWLAALWSRRVAMLTAFAALLDVVEIAHQWERLVATLVGMFSIPGLLALGAALAFTRMASEFGRAVAARRHGCRIQVIGIVFIALWPRTYTDIGETWKLRSRSQRLSVGSAGIATQAALAVWALLAWALLPDGLLRSTAFALAAAAWFATLLVDASPFLRSEGYFLLCDALGMPDLHARASLLAHWRLREALFGLADTPPEVLAPAKRRAMVAFAWATWAYRLGLSFAAALLVHRLIAEPLGIALATAAIGWFIVLPLWREVRAFRRRWPAVRAARRSRRSALAAAALVLLAALPWDFQVRSQGVLKPARSLPLTAALAGQLSMLPPPSGTLVAPHQELLQVQSAELARRIRSDTARGVAAVWTATTAALDADMQAQLLVLRQESVAAMTALEADKREAARLRPTAPFAGKVVDVPPDLHAGDWVGRNERLGTLIDPSAWRVETYLPAEAAERVSAGDGAVFLPETAGRPVLSLHVETVGRDATRVLDEGLLGSPNGGAIAAHRSGNQVVPDRALYRVVLRVDEAADANAPSLRGEVVIRGAPVSPLGGMLKAAAGLWGREF